MWERFSYYGITALLILYLSQQGGMSESQSYALYGAYGALIYMTPLIGGALADRLLGGYITVIAGSVCIALGHFVIACLWRGKYGLYLGLAFSIVGTGLFMPNINAMVGQLYGDGTQGRERGFTLVYMGRNLGTILAPIAAAYLATAYGWHCSFLVSGLGMLLGLATFLRGRHYYVTTRLSLAQITANAMISVVLLLMTILGLLSILLTYPWLVGPLLFVVTLAMIAVLMIMVRRRDRRIARQMITAMVLTGFYVVFLVLLQQSGGALNLFTEHYVRKTIWGIAIPTGMFQSIEPLCVVLLTPLYQRLWQALSAQHPLNRDPLKFVLGLIWMAASFAIMALGMRYANGHVQIAMHWVNITYLLQAAGELCIGPIGLAMVSRLIPQDLSGFFMGFWVLAMAVGNYLAAGLGAWLTPEWHAHIMVTTMVVHQFQTAFIILTAIGLVAATALAMLSSYLFDAE